ncbi:ATP-binding protein [Bacillus sp. V3B]|uniref:ATP-binding protein n=1 Tax=Bacillus sp. V3B TaxID=2804915 RepID=UPI00210F1A26|nr:ATP-binding protein [Bacillus sp. V3B]
MTQSQVDKLDGLEEKRYQCLKCQDRMVIIYRVHKDTVWQVDSRMVNGSLETRLVPESVVSEDDFLAGKVCSPESSWEWRDTYSKKCECSAQIKTKKLMKASEITEEFRNLGFKNFLTDGKPQIISDIRDCAMAYLKAFETIHDERANSTALLGQPGAGKTHLLTAIANNLINRLNVPVLYFPYVEGFNDLKDDFDKLEAKLERMKQVDVLFMDDLFKPTGRERKPRATDWQIEQTYAVINYRYLNHKPILISSELTVDELVDVDEALGTRIYQMCQDFTVVIKGDRKVLNHRLVGA